MRKRSVPKKRQIRRLKLKPRFKLKRQFKQKPRFKHCPVKRKIKRKISFSASNTTNSTAANTSSPAVTLTSNPNDTNTSNPVATNTNTVNPSINVNPVVTITSAAAGQQGLLTEFNFVPLDFDSTQGTVRFAVLNSTPLALQIDDLNDRVWLTFTVQWRSIQQASEARFSILRKRVGESDFTEICRTDDGMFNFTVTTTLTCVDAQPILTAGEQQVEYQVTAAEAANLDVLLFTGNGTFTGAVIEANN